MKKLLPFILLAVVLSGCAVLEQTPLGSPESLLDWLSDPVGGAWLVVSVAASWILEKQTFWMNMKSHVKTGIIGAIAVLISLGANWLVNQPELLAIAKPYTDFILAALSAWLATQAAHKVNPDRK